MVLHVLHYGGYECGAVAVAALVMVWGVAGVAPAVAPHLPHALASSFRTCVRVSAPVNFDFNQSPDRQ